MVDRKICTFCGAEIEPGTGRMYIKKDGVVYNFCTSKCYKNLVVLGRVPRRTTWTRYYEREKVVRMKGVPTEEETPKARKVRKEAAKPEEVAPKEEAKEAPKEKPKEPEAKPKVEEKKPVQKQAPKKEKPAPQKKSEPAKKEKPKGEAKPKRAEGAEE